MDNVTVWKVLFPIGNMRMRHLGSESHGMRTACGRILNHERTISEVPYLSITCAVCKRTAMFRRFDAERSRQNG